MSQVAQAGERQLGGLVGIGQPGGVVRCWQAFRVGTGEAERIAQGDQALLCTVMQVALQVGRSASAASTASRRAVLRSLTRASAPASRRSLSRSSRAADAASVTATGSIRTALPWMSAATVSPESVTMVTSRSGRTTTRP